MGKRLVITLDEVSTERYFEYAQRKAFAEIEADCEPGGVSIGVNVSPSNVYSSEVYLEQGNEKIDIGEAMVEIIEV